MSLATAAKARSPLAFMAAELSGRGLGMAKWRGRVGAEDGSRPQPYAPLAGALTTMIEVGALEP